MFDAACRVYALMLGYAERLVADVKEEQFTLQPSPRMNPPEWILGHLAVCTDYAAEIAGLPYVCSETYHQNYGPNSEAGIRQGAVPSKEELLSRLRDGHGRVVEAVPTLDPTRLERPNPVSFLRPSLPKVGDLLMHLLTSHEGVHLGQLSAWRRAVGLPPV